MVITEFGALNFRNYKECFVQFSDRINLFTGNNGQGKTNLAEGIYFLSHLSSFRTHRLEPLIRFGEELGHLQATVVKREHKQKTRIELTRHGRRVWLDERAVPTLSSYISLFYSLLFNPDSLYNHRHFPAERRALIDRFLSFRDRDYLEAMRDFRKVHAQKNRLLKEGEISSLSAWNQLFIEKSRVIIRKRSELKEKLNTFIGELSLRLTGGKEELRLHFLPSLHGSEAADGETLERAKERELSAGHALYGPHRDDFQMALEDRREGFFSQGEYRISLLALKLAMNELLAEEGHHRPVLILDDLYSELDRHVSGRLSEYLRAIPNQVFITTTQSPAEFGFPGEQIMEIRAGRIV